MIVVGSTMAAFVTDQDDTCLAWLRDAERIIASHPDGVRFFCAFQTDARGMEPFGRVVRRLEDIGGEWWSYSLDDGRTAVTTGNRIRHIVFGQNLTRDYALSHGASHLLFLAADLQPDPECLPKLLDLRWPMCGGEVRTYCLSGETVPRHPETGLMYGYPVATHMATAAFVLIGRDVLTKVHFRYDNDNGWSDDMALYSDAKALGYPTLVRKDCVGQHYPEQVPAIELRGHDMRVVR